MKSDLPVIEPVELMEDYLNDIALAIEETSDMVILLDKQGIVTRVNNSFSKVFDSIPAQITGTAFTDFLQHNHASLVKAGEISKAINTGKSFAGTVFMIHPKKRVPLWTEIKIKPVTDKHGKAQRYIVIARDITEHIKKNEELLYSELRWKFALEESGDGFFEYDLENHKFFGSENLLALVALSADATQLDFTALIHLIHPDDTEASVNDLFDLISGKTEMLRHELRIKNKDGSYVWTIIRATISNRTTDGKPLTLIGTTTDISYIKETEAALVKAKNEAEQASEYKNQFLSTMSHEIRTPLNAIIGITDIMRIKKPKGELKENLDILSFSANHLLSLINDVLDLSKIDSGKMEFVHAQFNLQEIMEGIYQTFLPKCRETGISLSYNIEKNVPSFITGDSVRLTQILNNLVNNAIKFTPGGSVIINVTASGIKSKEVNLIFEVIDTGIGIDKKKHKLIFEDFVQANSSIAHQYGGTGLGLAITKKLVNLQGGSIHVDSTPGKGSRFYFNLGFDYDKSAGKKQQHDGQQKNKENTIKNTRVLLVEDILANQKVAVSYLTHWQGKVECALNGEEALQLFEKYDFDILIIDLYMPVMNGFETIEQIRNTTKGKTIPIIALTASIETSVINKALQCGANACLGKPIEANRLLKEIQKLTGRKQATFSHKNKAVKTEKKQTRFRYISMKRIEDASLGSKPFIKEMIELLKKEIPDCIQACSDELNKKEYKKFSDEVHKLKNSLLMIGLDRIKGELVKLENNAKSGRNPEELGSLFGHVTREWEMARKELNTL